jgi:hypothetical protein
MTISSESKDEDISVIAPIVAKSLEECTFQSPFQELPFPFPFSETLQRPRQRYFFRVLMPWQPPYLVFIFESFVLTNTYSTTRFGTNLLIEEEKVQFPKGKSNLKKYDVSKLSLLRFGYHS